MTLSLVTSMVVLFLKHPLALGGGLLLQTTLLAMVTGFFYQNFWFSYILFLIMIGGMLVMFIYMTSIASNEKFQIPKKKSILAPVSSLSFLASLLLADLFYGFMMPPKTTGNWGSEASLGLSLSKFFSPPFSALTVGLMLYLLLTLVVVVKITNKPNGPLRQKK
uniref:NADH-ubiquinone oxidoreductase chain 6 n=1 Tax=Curculionoidea sp. 28 KM-2017 TaxID=2219412 RepID=A0A346RJ71_9CUCU|nr:NADH dehydrogenase subunit 6 [Curculionoidea sp. 28 KM-2017]